MEVFRDLFIRGTPDQRAALLDAFEGSYFDGWKRDRATEETTRSLLPSARLARCYEYIGDGRLAAATLCLLEAGADTLYVSNIVPHGGRLSCGQYNDLVTDFARCLRPHADKAGVTLELTEV